MTACVDAMVLWQNTKSIMFINYFIRYSLFFGERNGDTLGNFNKHKDKSVEKRLQRDMKNDHFFNTQG